MGGINIDQIRNGFVNPNICPHCHVVNEPTSVATHLTVNEKKEHELITIWQCANQKCHRMFIAEYKRKDSNSFKFSRFLNGLPKGPDWPKPILELKSGQLGVDSKPTNSNFIKTYLQSLEAENYGLSELAGMGYRKAIEYLVKDWAIQNKPEEKEKIENSWLGGVIKDYYEGDLKEILERATWLGNDQAHYNRLFKEFDIEVLKELIDLIMVELDRQYKKAHYIEMIKSKK